jgi:ACT domain-containing protein
MTAVAKSSVPAGGSVLVTRHVEMLIGLPDRPGGLGAVASRIGAVGGDITSVTIRARDGGRAEDVFHLDLPVIEDLDIVGLLFAELAEVDGVRIVAVVDRDDCGACALSPSVS